MNADCWENFPLIGIGCEWIWTLSAKAHPLRQHSAYLSGWTTNDNGVARVHGNKLEVWYDGACPLCTREIELMRRLDRMRGGSA